LRLGAENGVDWQFAVFPALKIIVGEPFFWNKQTLVGQRVSMLGDIGGEDTDLAIVYFADSAAVLSGNADRVLAFFDETA